MEADRLRSRRLPEDVVLENPRAPVTAELRAQAPGALREHLRCDHVVGAPPVADLPRAILWIPAGYPVDLVRLDPGLVDALEQWLVALTQQVESPGRHEPLLDDEEAVAIERRNLLGREPVDHERGRSLFGS